MNLSQPMQALLKACAAHDRVSPEALLARLIDARAKEIGVFRLASACREADAAQAQNSAAGPAQTVFSPTPYSVRAIARPLPQGVVTEVFVDCRGQTVTSRFADILDAAQIRAEAALMAARCFGVDAPGGAA